jgi:hypothetical protein
MGEWLNAVDMDDEISSWWKTNLDYENYKDTAIDKAEKYVRIRLTKYGAYPYPPAIQNNPDAVTKWVDDLKTSVLIPLTKWYLFDHMDQGEKVAANREDAIDSLRAMLEGGVSGEGAEEKVEEKVSSVASVIQGSQSWHNFNENPYIFIARGGVTGFPEDDWFWPW